MVDILEHQGKYLLQSAGLRVPRGMLVSSSEEATDVAIQLGGRTVCKAQIPTGKRGKAGAVQVAPDAAVARDVAVSLLGAEVSGYRVEQLVVEEAIDIAHELYAAVLDDPASKGPLMLFSTAGGMDIEEVNARDPELVYRVVIDIRFGLDIETAEALVQRTDLDVASGPQVAAALVTLYQLYREIDANMVEINPLVLTRDGDVVALDAKVTIDPGSEKRQRDLLDQLPGGTNPEPATTLERTGKELGLHYIELDGEVGVLANGAGLTMTTLDAVYHAGGRPANFLEIGGDAYTKATPALQLVLSNPKVKSLLVNFCGAFARTDVMTEGVLNAIDELRPDLPIAFTIHGTGEAEAIAMVHERLGVQPYDLMDDAVGAAVAAARSVGSEAAS